MKSLCLVLAGAGCLAAGPLAATVSPEPVPFRVPAAWPDALEPLSPAAVHLGGFLGQRIDANTDNRLLEVDLGPLLAGFQKRPGEQAWIGEHIGKWLNAATLAWAYSHNDRLRAKLDWAVKELIATQEPDGYLGTYVPGKRFGLYPGADWDVWVHKYDLIGLLTYYQYTGNPVALESARKVGDLLVRTFGPGRKSILAAGTHVGMAATSVLKAMVRLYRLTGDARYLAFARYIVQAWNEPNGPKIIQTLTTVKEVNKTANGKAYEMLSNLVGLCDLARVTGNRSLLVPVLNAWEDIVHRRLYVTGSTSQSEHFHGDYYLPNAQSANPCETCVTVTWIQLNLQLLRLTGEARFGNELERSFYNHLAAAQRPDGAEWCYFTSLAGTKPYGPGISCCVSSGPRGMAFVPRQDWFKYRAEGHDGLALNLFSPSRVVVSLDGEPVQADLQTKFPRQGGAKLTLALERPAAFAFKVRAPAWAVGLRLAVNGQPAEAKRKGGWLQIPARTWHDQDQVALHYRLVGRVIAGDHSNTGRVALEWGPFVLAYDSQRNPGLPRLGNGVFVPESDKVPFSLLPGDGLRFRARMQFTATGKPKPVVFVPFADAGGNGGFYRVWLRAPGSHLAANGSLLLEGLESRSRQGNQGGSINDGDPGTFVVTFNGRRAAEDWYAVKLETPIRIRRVEFAHGQTFHDGGWFDARAGKPCVQVQRKRNGPWILAAVLKGYPATTDTDSAGLQPGQAFTVTLPQPTTVFGVRVVGKPACGDNPRQAFSSCGELAAFAN